MMIENCRPLSLVPKFSRILRQQPAGARKFCSAVANVNTAEENATLAEGPEEKNIKPRTEPNLPGFKSFRFKFPEFLPNPKVEWRNAVREKLERRDMLRRRNVIHIPEFYVGSVLAVTSSDKHATNKLTRFVGICIFRQDDGLRTVFILRNILEHTGVEVQYSLYSPLIQQIEVLRLEKRLDENLFYLRDAPNEYSTFPVDMAREFVNVDKGVPVNTIKVPLNPRPWLLRYERMNLKGVILPEITEKMQRKAIRAQEPWKKYDLMDEYRATIPEEDQKDVFIEISDELQKLELRGRQEKKKKVFSKPPKQKLF